VFGLFKSAPKLEATFSPTLAVARELAREVAVEGELVVRNVGKDVELRELALVLVAGGTRRIDLPLLPEFAGRRVVPAGGELRATAAWKIPLAAPMRAPAAEIQLITTAGGKHTPLALSNRFPLANE
jgi:hypothetical protein